MLLTVVRCYIKNVTKLSQFYLDCWLHSQRKCIKVSSVGSYSNINEIQMISLPTIYCGYFSLRDMQLCCWKTRGLPNSQLMIRIQGSLCSFWWRLHFAWKQIMRERQKAKEVNAVALAGSTQTLTYSAVCSYGDTSSNTNLNPHITRRSYLCLICSSSPHQNWFGEIKHCIILLINGFSAEWETKELIKALK